MEMEQKATNTPSSSVLTGASFRAGAFTLLEIVVVLSLLALLAALAWPNLQGRITAAELPQSAEQLRSALYMTRSEAVMEHRRFRLRFVPGEQQPLIEWEPDPIQYPGVFEPAKRPWAKEPVLLADVQVHRVTFGRPEWTLPLSTTSQDEQELAKEEKKRLEQTDEEKIQEQKFLRGALMNGDGDKEDDEYRPMVVFGPDGSTEWATFVVARLDPEEELLEEMEQVWVVLDGRTGLATIREQVTEEQLADPEFYVAREKLELPDDLDVDDLTFQIGGDTGLGSDGQDLMNLMTPGGQQDLTSPGGQTTEFTSVQPAQVGGLGQGQNGPPANTGGAPPRGANGQRGPRAGTRGRGNAGDTGDKKGDAGTGAAHDDQGSKPEDQVDDPNLTEEEKQHLQDWMNGNR
jgi:type II secretory pathway pseudopilin PulG